MFNRKIVQALFCILLAGGSARAAITVDPNAKDRDQLRALKAVYENAINTNQMQLIKPHLADQFSFVTFTNREFTDFDVFAQRWEITRQAILKGGSYHVEFIPDRTLFFGDVAVAKGDSTNALVTGSGEKFQFNVRWTAVCRKVNGEWKVLRIHNSLDPFGNPVVLSGFRKAAIKLGVGCAIGGLILGGLLGMVISKRRTPAP